MQYMKRKSSPQSRVAAVCGFLATVLILSAACENKAQYSPPPPPKVTVQEPVRRDVTRWLELTGTTQAVNTVQLRARVEGYLEKVLFRDGEMVKKDQLLFLIQQNTYQERLQQAEATVLAQKTALEHAKIEFDRYTNLFAKKAAAETDVENWRYQRDSAQANLLAAQAQRDQARLDLGYTSVTAPFAGRIDRRLVDPGNLVGSGTSTQLAQLTQLDPLYVYFTVSEKNLFPLFSKPDELSDGKATGGRPIYFGLANEEGTPHEGRLDFAATTVSTTTGTLLARGVFPNPDGRIFPGQFARVKVPVGKEESALLVPQTAVGNDELGNYVLTVDEKNVVERRNVKTGTTTDEMYVIESGLEGNERVIVKGLLKAMPGRQVTPEQEGSSKQASRDLSETGVGKATR